MDALNIIFPVFFMIILGVIARYRQWISPTDNATFKDVVFGMFFPLLLFDIMFTSNFDPSSFLMIAYALIFWGLNLIIGFKVLPKWHGQKFAHIAPFLLTTVAGGSISLPLYISIMGRENAAYSVTFDIASSIFVFIVIPLVVSTMSVSGMSGKQIIQKTITNKTVIAVFSGLILNLLGLGDFLASINVLDTYRATMQMATSGLSAMILFTVGYDFSFDPNIIKPVIRVIISRVVLSIFLILGFFVIFPDKMQVEAQQVAVILFFMTTTSFVLPATLMPIYKEDEDIQFSSTFFSLYVLVTFITYVGLVLYYT